MSTEYSPRHQRQPLHEELAGEVHNILDTKAGRVGAVLATVALAAMVIPSMASERSCTTVSSDKTIADHATQQAAEIHGVSPEAVHNNNVPSSYEGSVRVCEQKNLITKITGLKGYIDITALNK